MVFLILIIKALLETSIIVLIYLAIALIGVFIADKVQICYRNWKIKKCNQRLEKEYEEFMQLRREVELEVKLYKEEREKYPLFYWKERIK